MLDYAQALTIPKAIGLMSDKLEAIRKEIAGLRADLPVKRPDGRVFTYNISNLGNHQQYYIPVEGHITGMLIGSDTAGRATFFIGKQPIVLWIPANASVFFDFEETDQFQVRNDTVSFTQPTGGTNWDVMIMVHSR